MKSQTQRSEGLKIPYCTDTLPRGDNSQGLVMRYYGQLASGSLGLISCLHRHNSYCLQPPQAIIVRYKLTMYTISYSATADSVCAIRKSYVHHLVHLLQSCRNLFSELWFCIQCQILHKNKSNKYIYYKIINNINNK